MNLLALHNLILVCIVFSCLLHNHHQIPWPPWCFADWVAIYNVIYIYSYSYIPLSHKFKMII